MDKCLESIVNQTCPEIEIILVDDCSTDTSGQRCDMWIQRDQRIRVIHKTVNEGAGRARNTGMEKASGQYILFVDSDDYLALDTVEKCVEEARKTMAQAIIFGHHNVNEKGEIASSYMTKSKQTVFMGSAVQELFLPDMMEPDPKDGYTLSPSCARAVMFELEPLRKNGWHFASEREVLSEDVYSLLEVYRWINSVAILPEYLYYYCENSASLTHAYCEGYYQRVKSFYHKTLALCDTCQYGQTVRRRLAMIYLSYTIAALKQEGRRPGPVIRQWRTIRGILHDDLLQKILREVEIGQYRFAKRMICYAMRKRMWLASWLMVKIKG